MVLGVVGWFTAGLLHLRSFVNPTVMMSTRTVRAPGAVVRSKLDTTSLKVAVLEPGETVHLIEEDCTYITDNCATRQVMRGRIEYPVDGWVSLKCLRDAVEEEDFVYKKGKVRSASAAKTTHDQGTVHVLVETDESDGNGEPGLRQDAKPHKRMQGMNAFARAATENLDESGSASDVSLFSHTKS